MSSRRRGVESGFIGQSRQNLNNSGYDEVYAGDRGNNPSGFAGMTNDRYNNNDTGFAGMAGNNHDNDDIAPINFGNQGRSPERNQNFRGKFYIKFKTGFIPIGKYLMQQSSYFYIKYYP